METNAGIWIDRSHAIVIVVTDGVEVTKSFIVAKRNAFRPSTESRQEHDYTRNDFVAEDRLDRDHEEK